VKISSQPKLFWSHLPVSPCLIDWGKSCTQRIPQNVLTLSRKVDECKPLAAGLLRVQAAGRGRAAQVDPLQPKLEPPGISSSKLKYDKSLSKFAFTFNLRRYAVAVSEHSALLIDDEKAGRALQSILREVAATEESTAGLTLDHFSAQPEPFLTFKIPPERRSNPSNPAINTP